VGYATVKNQSWNLYWSSQLLQPTVSNTICQQALVSMACAHQTFICQQALACAQQTFLCQQALACAQHTFHCQQALAYAQQEQSICQQAFACAQQTPPICQQMLACAQQAEIQTRCFS
jgi:hypothetical protein